MQKGSGRETRVPFRMFVWLKSRLGAYLSDCATRVVGLSSSQFPIASQGGQVSKFGWRLGRLALVIGIPTSKNISRPSRIQEGRDADVDLVDVAGPCFDVIEEDAIWTGAVSRAARFGGPRESHLQECGSCSNSPGTGFSIVGPELLVRRTPVLTDKTRIERGNTVA